MIKITSLLTEVQQDLFEKQLDAFLKQYKVTSCAAYVYKDGKPLFEYYKNASKQGVFGIGSVSKSIDKIAIMKLIELGKIKMSDKILQFGIDEPKDGINLVNYYDWDGWELITLEHLMKHSSGIPDLMNEIPEFNFHYGEFGQEQDPDKLEILRAVAKYPLHFKPGTEERYSNTNFWLIGKIIEYVTKKSYGDAIKELVFDPLDMKHTYWAYESTNPPKLVKGTVLDATTEKVIPPFPIKPFDAWAIFYSTPEDMLKLGQAYVNDALITGKTRKSFFIPEPENSPGQLGAIHDGYICRWDAYANSKVVFMMVINQFGQTVIDPLMKIATQMRDTFTKGK